MTTPYVPEILASTPNWFVVSKPAGWLTIPGRKGEGQLDSHILNAWAESQVGGKVWVCHRLDRETSGVVLFAKSMENHSRANQWFQNRKMKKIYTCLASGTPDRPLFKIQKPIAGAPSVTQIEVKEKFRNSFLARVQPATGRRHQIRIHLSGEGFPILGDSLYKGPVHLKLKEKNLLIERVALHASLLELPSGEVFEAALPQDFTGWIEALRADVKPEKLSTEKKE